MAKAKSQKGGGVPQKHLHSRISFLYQAAGSLDTALANTEQPDLDGLNLKESSATMLELSSIKSGRTSKQSLFLLSQLRAVSQKSQIRLSRQLKQSMCRKCNVILTPGKTSHEEIENLSVGRRKPWADVFVVTCMNCETKKRYPVGASRPPKKATEVNGSERTKRVCAV